MDNTALPLLERFARKVGHLIGSGVPLVSALEIIHSEAENPQFGEVLKHVIELMKDGQSLYDSLGQYPGFFSKSFLGLVRAGEEQGRLDAMMDNIAEGLRAGNIAPGTGILTEAHAQSAQAQEMADRLLKEAVAAKASDIHFIPGLDENIVQFRIDGCLHDRHRLERSEFRSLIARFKIMCCLDVAEQQLPQDGRMVIKMENDRYDCRLSIMPVVIGEKATLRLLSKEKIVFTPETIFATAEEQREFAGLLAASHGLTLFVGPAGSGKTTTAYCAIGEFLKKRQVAVATVESPVEYLLEGSAQMQVRPQAGLTWKQCLASVMRGDPDVVMVSELPDAEVMEAVLKIALTGHLVLATFPALDVGDALRRIMFLGAKPHVLASILTGIVAQRLVRKICPECAGPAKPSLAEMKLLGMPVADKKSLKEGRGCQACHFSGYRGRVPLYELFHPGKAFRDALIGATPEAVSGLIERAAYPRFRDKAIRLLKEGVTTISEVKRVLFSSPESL